MSLHKKFTDAQLTLIRELVLTQPGSFVQRFNAPLLKTFVYLTRGSVEICIALDHRDAVVSAEFELSYTNLSDCDQIYTTMALGGNEQGEALTQAVILALKDIPDVTHEPDDFKDAGDAFDFVTRSGAYAENRG